MRNVVWFSCGAASAVAAKLMCAEDPACEIVYCDTSRNEHPDNMRFLKDVERWLGRSIRIIASKDFQTCEEVWDDAWYMSGPNGAPCTTQLKKMPRREFEQPDDVHLFGFTREEIKRARDFAKRNPELRLRWILIENGYSKQMCLDEITTADIELPMMYRLGYPHNNCIGCVKSASPKYWNKIRRDFPEIFKRRAEQSARIGCDLVKLYDIRINLYQLPADDETEIDEQISCGPECGSPGTTT